MFGQWGATNHARDRLAEYKVPWKDFRKSLRRSKQVELDQTLDIQKLIKHGKSQLYMEYWYDESEKLLFTVLNKPRNKQKIIITITRRVKKGLNYL